MDSPTQGEQSVSAEHSLSQAWLMYEALPFGASPESTQNARARIENAAIEAYKAAVRGERDAPPMPSWERDEYPETADEQRDDYAYLAASEDESYDWRGAKSDVARHFWYAALAWERAEKPTPDTSLPEHSDRHQPGSNEPSTPSEGREGSS